MKILHVNDVANVGSLLARGQTEAGNDAEIIRFTIPFVRSPGWIKLVTLPARFIYLFKMNRIIKAAKADIIHIHFANFGWLGIIGNYSYYLHCHGSDIRKGLLTPVKRRFLSVALRKAEKVFYSTPDLKEIITSVRDDAIFLPNPIIIPDTYKEKFEEGRKRIFLFSEMNDELKGSDTAINILATLKEKTDIEVHALIYGKDYSRYRDLKWITFHNKLNKSEIYDFLQSFDVIVGQFSFGSLGVAELEAMACGLPVVSYFSYKKAYNTPPAMVFSRDVDSVVTHMLELFEGENLIKRGKENRMWVTMNHEYRMIARRVLSEYEC